MVSLKYLLKSNTNSNTLRLYTSVKLYPAVLRKQKFFTEEQKQHLTRTGFRWYIYYDFVNPHTGEMQRQKPIYFNVNKVTDFDQRLTKIKGIKKRLEKLLDEGWSPYEQEKEDKYTTKSCIDYAMDLKKPSVSSRTFETYETHVSAFVHYLGQKGLVNQSIKEIKKLTVIDFLNDVLKRTSARNRNNYRTSLSAIFSILEDNELIDRNFVKTIPLMKSQPKRNATYDDALSDKIFKYLEVNDPTLLLFIKLVSYNFLRPVEVVRLKCGDVNLQTKQLTVQSKTKANKLKVIPDLLIDDLSKLDLSQPDYFLFTPEGKPGLLETSDRDKRGYWGNRYTKVKKVFDLGVEYSIYSFRHTYITKLYRWLRKKYHISETLDRLQLITGHDSIQGLKNYLRKIDAELPNDWSEGLK